SRWGSHCAAASAAHGRGGCALGHSQPARCSWSRASLVSPPAGEALLQQRSQAVHFRIELAVGEAFAVLPPQALERRTVVALRCDAQAIDPGGLFGEPGWAALGFARG